MFLGLIPINLGQKVELGYQNAHREITHLTESCVCFRCWKTKFEMTKNYRKLLPKLNSEVFGIGAQNSQYNVPSFRFSFDLTHIQWSYVDPEGWGIKHSIIARASYFSPFSLSFGARVIALSLALGHKKTNHRHFWVKCISSWPKFRYPKSAV